MAMTRWHDGGDCHCHHTISHAIGITVVVAIEVLLAPQVSRIGGYHHACVLWWLPM